MNNTRRPVLGAVVGFLVGVAVVMVLVTIMQIRTTQVTNSPKIDKQTQTLNLIKDCTQPGGGCYERGQRQTAHAVGDINRVVILAAACSVGLDPNLSVPDRQNRISICVLNRLARETSR